jgi:hypothetical protein
MSRLNVAQQAFDTARCEFLSEVKYVSKFDFSKFISIDDVYNTTDEIQEQQGRTGSLRYLRKIQPYLERLQDYALVIEQFVQVKSDILALIWV